MKDNISLMVCCMFNGDSGKAATVDALCAKYPIDSIIRFSGGPNAAHNVCISGSNGDIAFHHTFRQFGSGTLRGKETYYSQHCFFDPVAWVQEHNELLELNNGDPNIANRFFLHHDTPIITPIHIAINHILEMKRGADSHGSCGVGLGVCKEHFLEWEKDDTNKIPFLFARDLMELTHKQIHEKYTDICRYFTEKYVDDIVSIYTAAKWRLNILEPFNDLVEIYTALKHNIEFYHTLPSDKNYIFEGSQGVLLDENLGFAPYNTWTDTTFKNADILNNELGERKTVKIGCIRSYTTRHGKGPIAEIPDIQDFNVNKNHKSILLDAEKHNVTNRWQGDFRVGYFDVQLLQYSLDRVKVDCLSISHLDIPVYAAYLKSAWDREAHFTNDRALRSFENPTDLVLYISDSVNIPVSIWGYGPCSTDRIVDALPNIDY